jgi:acetylglutamate kinase
MIEDLPDLMEKQIFSAGQINFLNRVMELDRQTEERRAYIIASPLNLLQELFTTKGSGTLIRRQIKIKRFESYRSVGKAKLTQSINSAFDKPLRADFYKQDLFKGYIEADYRGGALFTQLAGLPYLSKFWVQLEARGEGIARDLWDGMNADVPAFFWRSRMGNPFNDWYMRACDGMQISGDWRVFWKGLDAPEIPAAILAAASAPDDFTR